jgi:uncharacterized membrane protein
MTKTLAFWLAAFLSISIALASYRFVTLGLDLAFDEMAGHIANRRTFFLIHVVAAPIALATGLLQFLPRLRARRPGLHRWTGRLYGVAILFGGVSGLVMASQAIGGPVAGWGFALLALAWLGTTANAIRLAMKRDIAQHRRWMIRSFALTFAAVTLRLQLPFFLLSGMDYAEASLYVAWLCWLPNVAVTEWALNRKARRAAFA